MENEDSNVALPTLSLCTGTGALDLGFRLACQILGIPTSHVCYVEREAHAVQCLVQRIEDQVLDDAPVWSDLTTLDCEVIRGKVGALVAGFPCPPVSVAGKGAGDQDPRWLWPHVYRIIETLSQPTESGDGLQVVFLENVDNLLGFDEGRLYLGIRRQLEGLGFLVEEGVFSAEEVGAPHLRKRLFILAVRNGRRLSLVGGGGVLNGERQACGNDIDGCGGETVAYTLSARLEGRPRLAGDSGSELSTVEREGGGVEHPSLQLHDGSGGSGSGGWTEHPDSGGQLVDPFDPRRRSLRLSGDSRLPRSDGKGQTSGGPREQSTPLDNTPESRPVRRQPEPGTPLRHETRSGQPSRRRNEVVDPNQLPDQRPGTARKVRGQAPSPDREWNQREWSWDAPDHPVTRLFPPPPDAYSDWLSILTHSSHLAPALPLLGEGFFARILASQPGLRKLADGLASWMVEHFTDRSHELQGLGNGVVPQCAAVAMCVLWERIGRRLREGQEQDPRPDHDPVNRVLE